MKIITLAYLVTLFCHALGTLPQVKTPLGKIIGIETKVGNLPVKTFLGIPYAKPPVGSLRFQKPKPVKPWLNTPLQANKQPPACMQYSEDPYPWYDDMPGKSEDCLYMNIFTPFFATKGSMFPVIFWIFGGGYTIGSNRLDVYDASALAERERVIVVTINYRLGPFGFLTTNTEDAPGNMGMYDAIMALQWVNDYIFYFGGNKDKITLMGESAGASAVSLLCVSPLTKGLFSQAIMQSASIVRHIYNKLDFNLDVTDRLAKAVNCATKNFTIQDHPREVVECLRQRNATYLTKTLMSFFPHSSQSLYPQYGGDLLPNNAVDEVRNGKFHNVSILIGTLRDEGSAFLTAPNPDEFGFFGEKDLKVNKTYAKKFLQGYFANFTSPEKYIDFYLKDVPDDDYDRIRRQVYTAFGDLNLLCPTVYFAESYAERNNDVFYYFFTHVPSNTPWAEWMGVAHFEEVQFNFGRPVRVPEDYSKKEVSLSKQVMKMWGNFVRDGHPGVTPNWPKYSKKNHTYLTIDLDNSGKLGEGPHLESCNLLRSYFGF